MRLLRSAIIISFLLLMICLFVSCGKTNEEPIDTEQTSIQTEPVTEEVARVVINVKECGAVGDGITDDTAAFLAAVKKREDGQDLYIPKGEYLVTQNIQIQRSNVTVYGDAKDTVITLKREQKSNDTKSKASLLTFTKAMNVTIKELHLKYEGNFFEKSGESLSGKVSGLYVTSGKNIHISGIEAEGFNDSGIYMASGQDILLEECDLHHNRVAGLLYGNVDGVTIQKNVFTYNGSEYDGATGYGCVGHSKSVPKNVKVINNTANYNYRKGIDNHAGIGILIDGNTCHANRLYGIYTEGVNTGDITITNNVITGMSSANSKLEDPYRAVYGICVGVYNETNDGKERNYTVANNKILGFDSGEGTTLALYLYAAFDNGKITVTGNEIECKTVDYFLYVNRKSQAKSYDIDIELSKNTFSAEKTRLGGFVFLSDELTFEENTVNVGIFGSNYIVKAYGPSDSTSTLKNNRITIMENADKVSFASFSVTKPTRSGNTINGKKVD